MEVYSLRVARSRGKDTLSFPWDRVYLARYGSHQVFKRLFRYAFILPVGPALRHLLGEIAVDQYIERNATRTENEGVAVTPPKADWQKLLKGDQWVMAVPILTRYVESEMPKYIVASDNVRDAREHFKSKGLEVFPTASYLQTPDKDIRPICIACPLQIQHQAGGCNLGDPECYTTLSLGRSDYFKEGLTAPEPSENVKEAEMENEVLRERV